MTAADASDPTVEPLSNEECWSLLASLPLGRVAVSQQGEAPLVVPVNHLVEDRTIVFRSGPGMKLEGAKDAPISFQADCIDLVHHTGWSVLVRGVTTIEDRHAEDREPHPWAGEAGRTILVRLWPQHVSGRRIVAGALEWDPKGYM